MTKVRTDHLRQLLKALSDKSGHPFTIKGFKAMADEIGDIGEDYLYKKIHQPISKKKSNAAIGLRDEQLNRVAVHLGMKDFNHFISTLTHKKDIQLKSVLGNYYSYVRSNLDAGLVLRSPVQIWEEKDGRTIFELHGPNLKFSGAIQNRHGCLFILMEAIGGKTFHHIYKIGLREKPSVMQGVFSGVSTAFDPIGGRVVLIRNDDTFSSLKPNSLKIQDLKKSKLPEEKKLGTYFSEYANNNIVPNRSSTFGLNDL